MVVLHHACWHSLVDFVVKDVVQFPFLELSKMSLQHLDKLQICKEIFRICSVPIHVVTQMFNLS